MDGEERRRAGPRNLLVGGAGPVSILNGVAFATSTQATRSIQIMPPSHATFVQSPRKMRLCWRFLPAGQSGSQRHQASRMAAPMPLESPVTIKVSFWKGTHVNLTMTSNVESVGPLQFSTTAYQALPGDASTISLQFMDLGTEIVAMGLCCAFAPTAYPLFQH